MTKAKKAKTNKTVDKAVELTQGTAKLALQGAVQTTELTESYIQGLYNVGYDTNVEGLKVAKNYWNAATEIREDWVELFAKTGENMIDATAKIEVPTISDVTGFGKDIFENVSKTFQNLTTSPKS